MVLSYPEQQQVPSRKSIRALYEHAMKLEGSQQCKISQFGLLSLEEVLLPAVVKEQIQAVKKIQAKAQRDAPEVVGDIMTLRRAIYEATEAGIEAGRNSRAQREVEQAERDREWNEANLRAKNEELLRRRETRRLKREEAIKAKELEKQRQFLENKKKHPQNMEMWREVAMLMTELSILQKEEQAWKECQSRLNEQALRSTARDENEPVTERNHESVVNSDDDELRERLESAVKDILLCVRRVQNAVELTSKTIQESEKIRKELYEKYKTDHQFHGYKGVKNPKGLIRALSQSQDAYE
jgi:hypothetical protein